MSVIDINVLRARRERAWNRLTDRISYGTKRVCSKEGGQILIVRAFTENEMWAYHPLENRHHT